MSRSYKKHPFITDHTRNSTKSKKRFANKTFRNKIKYNEEIAIQPQFKKYFCSYDICDYRWRWTKQEAYLDYVNGKLSTYIYEHYPTVNDWLNYWRKCCKSK